MVASLIPVVADLLTVVGGLVDGFLGALSAALLGLILWAKSGQVKTPRTAERCCDRLTKDMYSKIVSKVDLDRTELQCLWYDAGITFISCNAYLRQ